MSSATLNAILALVIRTLLRLIRGEGARHLESSLVRALDHLGPPPSRE